MRLSISVASFVCLGEEIYSSRARIWAQVGLGPQLRPEILEMWRWGGGKTLLPFDPGL